MNIFKNYPNKYYVETGTGGGGSVLLALEAGFQDIRSIELSETLYNYSSMFFSSDKSVRIWHGDSTLLLWDMIKDIEEPITFFLDGHYSCGMSEGNNSGVSELIAELEQISRHPIKNHTILIDDMRDCKVNAEELIQRINHLYKFTRDTYHEIYPNDVLVAKI